MDWCKLYARYPDDPAVQRAGEAAEVLFLRSLAYCAQAESDGHIPSTQLPRFGLPRVQARVDALVREHLWTPVDDGWLVTRWRELQMTTDRIERRRKADRLRQASRRDTVRDSGSDSVRDSVQGHADREEKNLPPNPADAGRCPAHDKPAPNCRGCGTNPRALREQARLAAVVAWCGECHDESARYIADDNGDLTVPCGICHPRARAAS